MKRALALSLLAATFSCRDEPASNVVTAAPEPLAPAPLAKQPATEPATPSQKKTPPMLTVTAQPQATVYVQSKLGPGNVSLGRTPLIIPAPAELEQFTITLVYLDPNYGKSQHVVAPNTSGHFVLNHEQKRQDKNETASPSYAQRDTSSSGHSASPRQAGSEAPRMSAQQQLEARLADEAAAAKEAARSACATALSRCQRSVGRCYSRPVVTTLPSRRGGSTTHGTWSEDVASEVQCQQCWNANDDCLARVGH